MTDFKTIKTIHWKSRLSGSFKSIGFGFLIIIASIIILWINEGRAVKTTRGLKEGFEKVIEINPNKIDKINNGKLVHFSAKVTTKDTLIDTGFNIKTNALKLNRKVETYQWKEIESNGTTRNKGGSETQTTTYTYEADWYDELISSKTFKDKSKRNPTTLIIKNKTYQADTVKMGNFILSKDYVDDITDTEIINVKNVLVDTSLFKHAKTSSEYIYIGEGTINQPQIGDVRISFIQTKPNVTYSILAQQSNNTLTPYKTGEGTTINVFSKGNRQAKQMFESEHSKNTFLTWMLRVVGIALMFFGFKKIMEIFVVLGDVLPILGTLLNYGTSIIGGVLALLLSFLVISLAWFAYRPILLLILIAVSTLSFGVTYFFIYKVKRTY